MSHQHKDDNCTFFGGTCPLDRKIHESLEEAEHQLPQETAPAERASWWSRVLTRLSEISAAGW